MALRDWVMHRREISEMDIANLTGQVAGDRCIAMSVDSSFARPVIAASLR